ncbi:MAG: hypothetical protein V1784_01180 [bacterium]
MTQPQQSASVQGRKKFDFNEVFWRKTAIYNFPLMLCAFVSAFPPLRSCAVDVDVATDTGYAVNYNGTPVANGRAYLVTLQSHMDPSWISGMYSVDALLENSDVHMTTGITNGQFHGSAYAIDATGKSFYVIIRTDEDFWAAVSATDWIAFSPDDYVWIDLGEHDYFNYGVNPQRPNVPLGRTLASYYTLIAWAGDHGRVSPGGPVNAQNEGPVYDQVNFTATPQAGYEVEAWRVNGSVWQTGGTDFSLIASGNDKVNVLFCPAQPRMRIGDVLNLNFPTFTNFTYQLSWITNLCAADWSTNGFPGFFGTGSNYVCFVDRTNAPACFYRVAVTER